MGDGRPIDRESPRCAGEPGIQRPVGFSAPVLRLPAPAFVLLFNVARVIKAAVLLKRMQRG